MTTSVPKKLAPIQSYISSLHRCHLGPEKCFDGNDATICKSQDEDAPWLAFEFQTQINVSSVVIYNPPEYGNRTANVEVRVTDMLPAIGEAMFTEGHLIGNFTGPGKDGEAIPIETDPSRSGRYLLIQMDKRGFAGRLRFLNLLDVEVIGSSEEGGATTTTTTTTITPPTITPPTTTYPTSTITTTTSTNTTRTTRTITHQTTTTYPATTTTTSTDPTNGEYLYCFEILVLKLIFGPPK